MAFTYFQILKLEEITLVKCKQLNCFSPVRSMSVSAARNNNKKTHLKTEFNNAKDAKKLLQN